MSYLSYGGAVGTLRHSSVSIKPSSSQPSDAGVTVLDACQLCLGEGSWESGKLVQSIYQISRSFYRHSGGEIGKMASNAEGPPIEFYVLISIILIILITLVILIILRIILYSSYYLSYYSLLYNILTHTFFPHHFPTRDPEAMISA